MAEREHQAFVIRGLTLMVADISIRFKGDYNNFAHTYSQKLISWTYSFPL